MPSRGEDIVSYWKRRLPLDAMYTGKSRGRTLRAMTQMVTSMAAADHSKDDSNLLKKYEGKCRLAAKLSDKALPSLTYDETKSILVMIQNEGYTLPVDILRQVIDKRAATFIVDNNYAELFETVNAFATSAELDPLKPAVSAMPGNTSQAKFNIMTKVLFSRCLVPKIMEGEGGMQHARTCAEVFLTKLQAIDIVDLDDEAAEIWDASATGLRSVLGVINLSCTQELMQSLQELKEASDKRSSKDVLHSICCAIEATAFYERRMSILLKARVKVEQHGPKLVEMSGALGALKLDDTEATGKLMRMCTDYELIKMDLPMELIMDFGQSLRASVETHWPDVKKRMDSGGLVGVSMKPLLDLYVSAARLHKSSDKIAGHLADIRDQLATLDAEERLERLMDELSALVECDLATNSHTEQCNLLEKASKCMDEAAGLQTTPPIRGKLHSAQLKVLNMLNAAIASDGEYKPNTMAVDFLSKSLELCSDDKVQKVYEMMSCLGTLCTRRGAVTSTVETAAKPNADEMKSFAGMVVRVRAKLSAATGACGHDDMTWKSMFENATEVLAKCTELVEEAQSADRAEKKKAFEDALEKMTMIPGVANGAKPWYDAVGFGADYKTLEDEANKVFSNFTVMDMRTDAARFLKTANVYEDSLRSSGDVQMPDDLQSVQDIYRKLVTVACALKCFFLLSKDGDKEMRTKVVAEVRLLREAKLREKDVLPEALFARLHAVLQKGK